MTNLQSANSYIEQNSELSRQDLDSSYESSTLVNRNYDHARNLDLGLGWIKFVSEANRISCPINCQPIWTPVPFLTNLNRLTCRWEEPSIYY